MRIFINHSTVQLHVLVSIAVLIILIFKLFYYLAACHICPWRRRKMTDQMLLMMKKSWMKMQPNGRIPPIRIPGTVRMYID